MRKGERKEERGRQMYKGVVVTSVPHSTADPSLGLLPMALASPYERTCFARSLRFSRNQVSLLRKPGSC